MTDSTSAAGIDAPVGPVAPVVAYPPDAVLTVEQLARALQCSVRSVERMNLPCVYVGPRIKRYVWRRVLDTLAERSA